jgi:holo-[acyl-carrier protein] synthase
MTLQPPAGFVVLGLGNDLCNIERIQNSIDRFGQRFLDRIYTPHEQAKAARRPFTATATYAKRFAAKEAASKALGTGFRQGVFFRDIGVVNEPSGRPTLALAGGAAARLAAITPSGYRATIHLTLTDDHPWAQAIVLITASPDPP